MTAKKYEFTGETKKWFSRTLRRIRRLSDGVLGGWLEGEHNLCNDPNTKAWVADEAKVYGEAIVYGQANVWGQAIVCEQANVWGRAKVYEQAKVYGQAEVFGQASVFGEAKVFGQAEVFGQASVFGEAKVFGRMELRKNMKASRSPLHALLTDHGITVADDIAAIGCEVHPFEHWRKHIEEIGRKNSYSEADIALYRSVLFSMMERKEALGGQG